MKLRQRFTSPRVAFLAGGACIAAVAVLVVLGVHILDFAKPGPPSHKAPQFAPGTVQQFNYLAAQNSNSCGLTATTVRGYTDDTRIQGACCNPLDMAKYKYQVEGLRSYQNIPQIPEDPYDVPTKLAKELLGYDDMIHMSSADQATFDKAMSMTEDKGPCCCKCWRWYAHEGLAKYLITAQHMGASDVSHIIDLVNGCGGPLDSATTHPPPGSG